jgi:hypothetical protein
MHGIKRNPPNKKGEKDFITLNKQSVASPTRKKTNEYNNFQKY